MSTQPVTINLQLTGMAQIAAGLKGTASGLNTVAASNAKAGTAAKMATGPLGKYIKAIQDLNATAKGTIAHADAVFKAAAATRALSNAQKTLKQHGAPGVPANPSASGSGRKFGQGLATGGGIGSLIGDVASMGPLGVAAAAAATALGSLFVATKDFVEYLDDRAKASNVLGTGKPGDAAAAEGLLGPGGAASARSIREEAFKNPQFGADTGIPTTDPVYDSNDDIQRDIARAMKKFRHNPDEAAKRRIRLTSPEFATEADNMPDSAIDEIEKASSSAASKPQWVKDREIQSRINHARSSGRFWSGIGSWFGDQGLGIHNAWDAITGKGQNEHAMEPGVSGAARGANSSAGSGGSGSPFDWVVKAIKDSAKTTEDLTEIMTKTLDWSKGNMGQGNAAAQAAAGGAIPRAWIRYQNLYHNLRGDVNRLGAFSQ